MKNFFLPILLVLTTTCFAQQKDDFPFKSFYELYKSKPNPGKIEFQFPLESYKRPESMQVKNAKVIRLPLDNMPCLVPDTKGFNMPVKGYVPTGNMPVLNTIPTFIPVK